MLLTENFNTGPLLCPIFLTSKIICLKFIFCWIHCVVPHNISQQELSLFHETCACTILMSDLISEMQISCNCLGQMWVCSCDQKLHLGYSGVRNVLFERVEQPYILVKYTGIILGRLYFVLRLFFILRFPSMRFSKQAIRFKTSSKVILALGMFVKFFVLFERWNDLLYW